MDIYQSLGNGNPNTFPISVEIPNCVSLRENRDPPSTTKSNVPKRSPLSRLLRSLMQDRALPRWCTRPSPDSSREWQTEWSSECPCPSEKRRHAPADGANGDIPNRIFLGHPFGLFFSVPAHPKSCLFPNPGSSCLPLILCSMRYLSNKCASSISQGPFALLAT